MVIRKGRERVRIGKTIKETKLHSRSEENHQCYIVPWSIDQISQDTVCPRCTPAMPNTARGDVCRQEEKE